MNQMELLQNIAKYLARFSEQIKILNGNNEFHINIHAENLLLSLLNITYDLKLVNTNHAKNGNYVAIDLLDKEKQIAFQITSTTDAKKVQTTIEKFFSHQKYKSVSNLNIYILTEKKLPTQSTIDAKIKQEKEKLISTGVISHLDDILLSFKVQEHILDKQNLYKHLYNSNDLEKIKRVENILKKQFTLIEEENDLSDYHNSLKNLYYDIVMNDERGMTLDQIYVEPSFSIHYNSLPKKEIEKSKDKKKFYHADHRYKIHEFIDDYLNGNNYLKCNSDCRLFLILGYPGQGKSSFLKRFINDYIKSNRNEHKPLYYFQLRNIRNVREFIDKPLEVLYDEACLLLETELNKFKFNKSFLLLDGLDELYMRENLRLDDIDKVCKELVMITEKYKNLNIIMTSRYGYVDDERLFKEKLLLIQLAEFSVQDQKQWLDKFKVFHNNTRLTDDKLTLFNNDNKYNYIKELIRQPLLLHMTASLNQDIDENINKSKIYSQLFTELIDRKYSQDGQLESLRSVTKDNLRSFLREIAFSIYQTGEEYITKNALLKLESTKEYLGLFPGSNFADSIKGVMISFYFKEVKKTKDQDYEEDNSNYAIEFLHKSLKEFLVAEKIVTTLSEDFLDKKKSNGKYVIDDPKQALKVIWNLCARRELSDEIKSYIIEIIKNKTDLNNVELCDRILMHLDFYLSKDFIYNFDSETATDPIKKSNNCFNTIWLFVSSLGLSKNYLNNSDIKNKFVLFLNQTYLDDEFNIDSLDFSYQDLSSQFLGNIEFYDCKFFNTNFNRTMFSRVTFTSCLIENCSMNDCEYDHLYLNEAKIQTTTFINTYLHTIILNTSTISDCSFEGTYIDELKIKTESTSNKKEKFIFFKKCSFKNINTKDDVILKIKKNSADTILENVIVYNKKKGSKPRVKKETIKKKEYLPEDYKRLIIR